MFLKVIAILLLVSLTLNGYTQTEKKSLPVTVFAGSDTSKPVLFYISGDGGWNKFSTVFVQNFTSKGYEVVGLNAREYFWEKKTAAQTSKDMSSIIADHMKPKKNKSFVLIGYSFGADVMPFAIANADAGVMNELKYVVLMSPSSKTDFEVHVSELLGIGSSSGESVVAEMNKVSKPILFISGEKENDFPLNELKIKNYKSEKIPGGHHYDGDPAAVCNIILQYIK
ncbi:MAG: AcvB/VirJ family lysyl-phosphatidylglycerol hydrolase [Chitinophagaceae bacterium]